MVSNKSLVVNLYSFESINKKNTHKNSGRCAVFLFPVQLIWFCLQLVLRNAKIWPLQFRNQVKRTSCKIVLINCITVAVWFFSPMQGSTVAYRTAVKTTEISYIIQCSYLHALVSRCQRPKAKQKSNIQLYCSHCTLYNPGSGNLIASRPALLVL